MKPRSLKLALLLLAMLVTSAQADSGLQPGMSDLDATSRLAVLGEDVIRMEDGKITDVWPLFDPLRLMLQIGAVEAR